MKRRVSRWHWLGLLGSLALCGAALAYAKREYAHPPPDADLPALTAERERLAAFTDDRVARLREELALRRGRPTPGALARLRARVSGAWHWQADDGGDQVRLSRPQLGRGDWHELPDLLRLIEAEPAVRLEQMAVTAEPAGACRVTLAIRERPAGGP